MSVYVIRLENGDYVTYEQTDDYEVMIEGIYIKFAETFNSFEEAESFAIAINNRRDGKFRILSPENAMTIVGIDENGKKLSEHLLLQGSSNENNEYIVEVTKDGYVGHTGWEESIYINTEKDEDFEDIFKQFIGKKIKLTIEVLDCNN